jgi:DNA-binding SARP family transcriptional activator
MHQHAEQAVTQAPTDAGADVGAVRVGLLDGFALFQGGRALEVAPGSQKLLAFLALRERPAPRSLVAGQLWPEAGEDEALARLRSALWRLRRRSHLVVESHNGHLRLVHSAAVDVREMHVQVARLLDLSRPLAPGDEDPCKLYCELLPDWWDDWVVVERERLRQLRLHALESLAARLAGERRFARALDVALAAVAAEPLRETPHRSVIAIHLAEGNRSEALRCYEAYRTLLCAELGVEPSPRMEALVATLRDESPGIPAG